MRTSKFLGVVFSFLAVLLLASCGGGGSASMLSGQQTGTIFTMGSDNPALPAVLSAQVQLTSITLSDGTTTVNLLNGPQTVDFAKLNGLRSLLDLNDVPAGNYNSATIMVGGVTIGFLDTTQTPPALKTLTATVAPMTVNIPLAKPLVLADQDLVGFFMDLDLRQSIQTDANGNITGNFTPTFDVRAISVEDADAFIDNFYAGVISVNPARNQFVIQGPHGRQFTVDTDSNTEFDDPSIMPADFDTNTIVEVSGKLNRVTRDIIASEVEVISRDHFVVEGLDTFVQNTNGHASQINLYTRVELPNLAGAPLGQIDPVALTGNETYLIANLRTPLTALLFGPGSQLAGQRIVLGGKLDTSSNPPALTVHRVVLERQGQRGSWVVGSTQIQSGNAGTFTFNDNYIAGVLLPKPLTIISTNFTNFINLGGLSDLSGAQPIPLRIIGFILMDPLTNTPVMVARTIERMNQ